MPRESWDIGRPTQYQGLMDVGRYAGASCASELRHPVRGMG
jgi:hypothetical protein